MLRSLHSSASSIPDCSSSVASRSVRDGFLVLVRVEVRVVDCARRVFEDFREIVGVTGEGDAEVRFERPLYRVDERFDGVNEFLASVVRPTSILDGRNGVLDIADNVLGVRAAFVFEFGTQVREIRLQFLTRVLYLFVLVFVLFVGFGEVRVFEFFLDIVEFVFDDVEVAFGLGRFEFLFRAFEPILDGFRVLLFRLLSWLFSFGFFLGFGFSLRLVFGFRIPFSFRPFGVGFLGFRFFLGFVFSAGLPLGF